MKTKMVFTGRMQGLLKILFVLIAVQFFALNCNNKDEEKLPVPDDEIVQPANPTDPAVLPDPTAVIQEWEGDFSPLVKGIAATWRVKSHKQFGNLITCWSDWVESYYFGVTREGVLGQAIYYPGCGGLGGGTWTPNFSESCSGVWGQYRKGQEIQDGGVHQTPGGTVNFYRYYTINDLPEAYILMEKRWEVVPIPGEGDYAYCQGCTILSKTTSTTTGLAVDNTREWGYTLGIEYQSGVNVDFFEAGAKVTASFNQQFSTSIKNYQEETTSLSISGTLPEGKSIIRLQVFREITSFKLVNKDGGEYYPGILNPDIQITTQTKNYIWYY